MSKRATKALMNSYDKYAVPHIGHTVTVGGVKPSDRVSGVLERCTVDLSLHAIELWVRLSVNDKFPTRFFHDQFYDCSCLHKEGG